MSSKRCLLVLFGGRSAEHNVSCVSARHVIEAADPELYEVIPVGIDKSGDWHLAEKAIEELKTNELKEKLEPTGPAWNPIIELQKLGSEKNLVVFPLLHGPLGEDGTIQGLLEVVDVPYIGSGVLGSALAMDKIATKEILTHHNIPQALYQSVHSKLFEDLDREGMESMLYELFNELGPIVFVKPANLGSSIGVSRANDHDSLKKALEKAFAYDEWVIVEEAIEGREIELSVLGDLVPQVSPPGEIKPMGDFYDYAEKYQNDSAELIDEPDIEANLVVNLQQISARVFLALRCSGMARVDFFLHPERGPILNEVNTIPGFTPISMYPRLWQKAGLSYSGLVDRLADIAVQRFSRKRHNTVI